MKHIATGWFIEYYVTNPFTQTLERRKFRLNNLRKRCRTAMEFKVQANTICSQLNVKLANGWNPFNEDVKTENPGAVPIKIVYEQYFRDVEKDLRPDTLRGYKAFSRRLLEWCDKRSPDMLLKDFSDVMAVRYLDEQRQKNNWVNATFNNNLVSAQAFFTWCVKKKFIEKNPFYGISKKKKEAKKRTVINADARAIMREWFMNNNPGYLLICELVFQSLIRPTEISKLRVSDVDLEHKVIHLDGSITKTKYSRKAVLSDELIEILGRNIQGANQDDYPRSLSVPACIARRGTKCVSSATSRTPCSSTPSVTRVLSACLIMEQTQILSRGQQTTTTSTLRPSTVITWMTTLLRKSASTRLSSKRLAVGD